MKSRMPLAVSLLLAGLVLLVPPAMAGGWAVITLDALPGEIPAGEPLEVGFTVRQHGVTPLDGLTPAVFVRRLEVSVTEQAQARGAAGHYVATLTIPQAGEWQWSIQAFTGSQPMPPLTVITETSFAGKSRSPASIPSIPTNLITLIAGGFGIAGLAAGLFVALRRKARWAILLVLAGLIVSAGSIVSAAQQPAPKSDASDLPEKLAGAQVETGRQLFIAKGCMVCHSHSETNSVREFGVDVGPDLTNKEFGPEYLQLWLKDPRSVKPATQMPNLELSESEIEALIAFLNAD